MLDLTEDEMRHLMGLLKEHRWTVADYPEGGNIPAWTIMQSRRIAPITQPPADKNMVEEEKVLRRALPYAGLTREQLLAFEQHLLDRQLGATMQMWRERKPWIRPMRGMLGM